MNSIPKPKVKVKRVHISELKLDPKNARKRTPLSAGVIQRSLEQFGGMRSIVGDEHGTVYAGNGTIEEAGQLGIEDVIVVEGLTGNEIVMVQRSGLTEEQWRQYAIADNTASDFSTWDAEVLAEITGEVDLSSFFPDDKLEEILGGDIPKPDQSDWDNAFDNLPSEDRQPFQQMTFTLHDDQVEIIKNALDLAKKNNFSDSENENSNGNALNFICVFFINHVS